MRPSPLASTSQVATSGCGPARYWIFESSRPAMMRLAARRPLALAAAKARGRLDHEVPADEVAFDACRKTRTNNWHPS